MAFTYSVAIYIVGNIVKGDEAMIHQDNDQVASEKSALTYDILLEIKWKSVCSVASATIYCCKCINLL